MTDYILNFKKWFKLKVFLLKFENNKVVFKQNDIWSCSIGMNLGEEIFGKGQKFNRPVLIFKKFTSNSFLGLPLTSKEKSGSWYTKITLHGKNDWVILNQARILDKKRLTKRLGTLDDTDMRRIRKDFLKLYGA